MVQPLNVKLARNGSNDLQTEGTHNHNIAGIFGNQIIDFSYEMPTTQNHYIGESDKSPHSPQTGMTIREKGFHINERGNI